MMIHGLYVPGTDKSTVALIPYMINISDRLEGRSTRSTLASVDQRYLYPVTDDLINTSNVQSMYLLYLIDWTAHGSHVWHVRLIVLYHQTLVLLTR